MNKLLDQYLLLGALIVFGATAHALAQLSSARKAKVAFDRLDFTIALVISAFSGTIFGIMANYWWSDPAAIHAIAGTGAFLGLKGLNIVSDAILDVLLKQTGKGPSE